MVIVEVKGVTCLYNHSFFKNVLCSLHKTGIWLENVTTQRKEAIANIHRKSSRRVNTRKNIVTVILMSPMCLSMGLMCLEIYSIYLEHWEPIYGGKASQVTFTFWQSGLIYQKDVQEPLLAQKTCILKGIFKPLRMHGTAKSIFWAGFS